MDINVERIEKQLITDTDIDIDIDTYSKDKTDVNIIQEFDFTSINNIKITEKIKTIFSFSQRFDVFLTYDFVKIGEVSKKYLELDLELDFDLDLQHHTKTNYKNKNKYVSFTYKKNNYIDLKGFLLYLPTPKLFVFHIIDSFSYLMESLLLLHEKNICFFNINVKNIVFDKGLKPILKDFSKSILNNNLQETHLKTIVEKIDDYTLKPLETHVLFYLINNDETTLSYSSIDSICDYFTYNNPILDLFSEQYREKYYQSCLEVLKKYINKPKNEIIKDIIQHSSTWDNYSLSILYLFFVGNFVKVFSLKGGFLSKFSIILNKNLHPDPLKRESVKNTQTAFQSLFHEYLEWDFANNLSSEKYMLYLKLIRK